MNQSGISRICVICLTIIFFASMAAAADFSKQEINEMNAYLSKFMAVNQKNIKMDTPDTPEGAKKILDYAIKFAQMDDGAHFAACAREECPWGELTVAKKYVDNAIRRYFGYNPDNFPVLNGKGAANFDKKSYHTGKPAFTGLKAKVKEAKLQPVGLLMMRGDVLSPTGEVMDQFIALAWPIKFGTSNSYSLVSLVYESSRKKA